MDHIVVTWLVQHNVEIVYGTNTMYGTSLGPRPSMMTLVELCDFAEVVTH